MTRDASPAIEPIYPLGDVGERVTVYEGGISINDCEHRGTIDFHLMPRPSVRWNIPGLYLSEHGSPTIALSSIDGDVKAKAECSAHGNEGVSGSITTVDWGRQDVEMIRVVVNWLNLPSIRSPGFIYDSAGQRAFAGRWTAVVDGWRLTLDERADHRSVWQRAQEAGSIVMTHVMELRREDGEAFTAARIKPVLDAMQLGLSFAVGRMVSPVLPVGLDSDGNRVWCQYAARLCTAGAPGALRWWFEQREWELTELLDRLVKRFVNKDEQFSLRFLITSAVLCAASGLVEQRVMTAFAALEHFAWTRLVGRGELSQSEYGRLGPASGRLTEVLRRAAIPCEIDGRELPALSEAEDWLPSDVPRTGPGVTAWVRNKIVHPTGQENLVYRHDNLLLQTWFLVNHYLVLLVLYDLGYSGSYQRRLAPGGWAGEVEPVPWIGDDKKCN